VATGPYRPPTIHELRYGSTAVGEQAALGDGLTYTGVTSGGGFEDQLYAVPTDNGGLVNGKPAVVSPVCGGNATLAWEPTPGVVAYNGYSGSLLDAKAITALHRLAGQARALTSTEWQATHPQTIDQINEPGRPSARPTNPESNWPGRGEPSPIRNCREVRGPADVIAFSMSRRSHKGVS
jgi:hypothetical protein